MQDPALPTSGRRPGWLGPAVLGAGAISAASGFAQFTVTAVIGDVAAGFGTAGASTDVLREIGVTGTTLGVALALIRLAGLAALPATALADRLGRRRVLLTALVVGLALTAASGGAPTFWIWVALVTLARPWLSTVNAVAGVLAAEETASKDRTAAIALISAAYGLGAGAVAVLRTVLADDAWRPAMLLSAAALLVVPLLARLVRESPIFIGVRASGPAMGRLGAVPPAQRRRLLLLAAITAGMGVATGPGFTYLFVYGERVVGASSGTMSLLVLGAGPTGLVGLLAGRWAADRLGRRPTIAVAMVATAGSVAVAYSGTFTALAVGYLVGITVSAAFGPAMGALVAESFPTSTRSTATGWLGGAGVLGAVAGLAAYGMLVDTMGGFGPAAMLLMVPVIALVPLLAGLAETRGNELVT